MYKKLKNKEGVGGLDISEKCLTYTLTTKDYRSKLFVENFNEKIIFTSEEERVNRIYSFDDFIAYSPRRESVTKIVNLRTLVINEIEIVLNNLFPETPYVFENLYYNLSEIDNNTIYDLSTGEPIKVVEKKITGFIVLNTLKFLITRKDSNIYIYNKTDFSLLWQKDLGEYLKRHSEGKEIEGQITQVKLYKDSIIVVSDGGVLRLVLETGEILWKFKGYTRTMEIVGETGYCCSSLGLWKLNLETGQDSGYGWEYHRLPDIEWNGRTFWPGGHEVIYHDGLLWYSVYASGESFLVAINPHDGYYEWVHHVDTNEKTDSPVFHGDKMFLKDTGGTLHIYEKEN